MLFKWRRTFVNFVVSKTLGFKFDKNSNHRVSDGKKYI